MMNDLIDDQLFALNHALFKTLSDRIDIQTDETLP